MPSIGSDIIVFDGSLENYIKATNTCNIAANNAVVANSGGLLMVQTNPAGRVTNENAISSCYVINSDPLTTVAQQPRFIASVNDQDILSMPTVIVCEENHSKISATSVPSSKCLTCLIFIFR